MTDEPSSQLPWQPLVPPRPKQVHQPLTEQAQETQPPVRDRNCRWTTFRLRNIQNKGSKWTNFRLGTFGTADGLNKILDGFNGGGDSTSEQRRCEKFPTQARGQPGSQPTQQGGTTDRTSDTDGGVTGGCLELDEADAATPSPQLLLLYLLVRQVKVTTREVRESTIVRLNFLNFVWNNRW